MITEFRFDSFMFKIFFACNSVSVSVLVQSRFYYYLWIGLFMPCVSFIGLVVQQLLSRYIPPFPFGYFILGNGIMC